MMADLAKFFDSLHGFVSCVSIFMIGMILSFFNITGLRITGFILWGIATLLMATGAYVSSYDSKHFVSNSNTDSNNSGKSKK